MNDTPEDPSYDSPDDSNVFFEPDRADECAEDRILHGLSAACNQLDSLEQLVESAITPELRTPRPKKLIIQIPCFNEEESLGITLAQLPREVTGVDLVEWLVIDDGSRDQTVKVARECGVDHIVSLPRNQGLARAFTRGLEAAVAAGADIIVNTDADNQYRADDIEKLIEPIINGSAEFVVGERPIADTPHFSGCKKLLQRLGSWVVRRFSKTDIPDAPSGFRAFTRETAMRLKVFSDYTYTLETIIQAGQKSMAITSVPISTNPDLRPSRLLKSIPNYISQSALTIVRIFATYRPFHFFALPSLALGTIGLAICLRFVVFYFTDGGAGHIQSLILGALLIGLSFAGIVVGLVADLISVNRKLLEQIDWQVKQVHECLRTFDDNEPQPVTTDVANLAALDSESTEIVDTEDIRR